MKERLTYLDTPAFRDLFKSSKQINIDDEFCVVDIDGGIEDSLLYSPFRFDGLLMVWCVKGSINVSVNMNEFELQENTLFLSVPGNILKIGKAVVEEKQCRYVCLAMSKNFASNQKVDVSKMFSSTISLMDDPNIAIRQEDASLMNDYLEMMKRLADSDITYRRESVQALWASMLYIFADILERRNTMPVCPVGATSRSRLLFEQFIELVSKYYDRYRNVGFYADKLCLTPKYLSKLIKSATGRSAPEWIDAYVILEAKNLLKYSNDTIKEIVYKLNFPNQSVFYKFFKARTGMTPSEYRNS